MMTADLVIKAAGRLDEFIHELLTMLDCLDYMNPVLVKFSNSVPSADIVRTHDYNIAVLSAEYNHQEKVDNDFSQLFDECSDFLNSSTSTSFTTHLMT